MDEQLKKLVRARAGEKCEYCLMPQAFYRSPFQVEHIIAQQHRGPTRSENLAFACMHCNLHKGPNIAGIDPEGGELSHLFNPRTDRWDEHFHWQGGTIIGRSRSGRTTVYVLNMNDADIVSMRESLILEGYLLIPKRGMND